MKWKAKIAALCVVLLAGGTEGADLGQETAAAWNHYLGTVDARLGAHLDGEKPFLWVDEDAIRAQRVRQGEIVVSHLGRAGTHAIPHGLIHDWIGAIFIPNATIHDVLAVVRDYDRYAEVYKPEVVSSRLFDRSEGELRFSTLWLQKVLFVTAALNIEYQATYSKLSHTRWYATASSTRLREIHDYGQPNQRELSADEGSGYLWRIRSLSRFEERDGGVYMELEAIGLSRDIPHSFRWLVDPVVARVSREFVANSLRKTRDAVLCLPK